MTSSDDAVASPSLMNDIILHENDLTEQAKKQFDYHNDILRAFDLNRRSILENNQLTRVGRHLAFSTLEELHRNCKQVLNYVAANNVSQNLPDIGPLVICGLPRTGTTLLYNLLACDPNCRASLHTEISVQSVPPISRSNLIEHERRAKKEELNEQARQQLVGRSSIVSASHPSFATEEDSLILCQAAMSIILSSKNKDQLLLHGFRYRRDRLVWRCIKDKCKGRARFYGNICEAYKDHTCQAPNPEEIEKAIYNYDIRKKAANSHDPPRLIYSLASVISITSVAFVLFC